MRREFGTQSALGGILALTFLAQLGKHSPEHHSIANIAMGLEIATMGLLFVACKIQPKHPEQAKLCQHLAGLSFLLTLGCVSVALVTDNETKVFFQQEQHNPFNPQHIFAYTKDVLIPQVHRHVFTGLDIAVGTLSSR